MRQASQRTVKKAHEATVTVLKLWIKAFLKMCMFVKVSKLPLIFSSASMLWTTFIHSDLSLLTSLNATIGLAMGADGLSYIPLCNDVTLVKNLKKIKELLLGCNFFIIKTV